MTTKVNIENDVTSNGDVHIRGLNISSLDKNTLKPGEKAVAWITDSTMLTLIETWPAVQLADTHVAAGKEADEIIAGEVARQDKMWGVANERADSNSGQLLAAGLAQAHALYARRVNGEPINDKNPPSCYPADWSGFRDYGSDVANIAVAVAFLRQEMKRLIASGADTTRTARDPAAQPYTGGQPAVQL